MLKPIETEFMGVRYRSRLEARWGVFFHSLGIPFKYESEGFDLDGLWYLPDFFLPEHNYWIEIKGREPTDEDWEKVLRLAAHVDEESSVFLFQDIPSENSQGALQDNGGYQMLQDRFGDFEPARGFFWSQCPICQETSIVLPGDKTEIPNFTLGERCRCLDRLGSEAMELTMHVARDHSGNADSKRWLLSLFNVFTNHNSPPVVAAYRAARMARFEHGRSGN